MLGKREKYVAEASNYFVYLPSAAAKEAFFYPICTGNFIYEPGYYLERSSYDSFLLMYLKSGSMTVTFEGQSMQAAKGSFVLLDCYQKHAYGSLKGCECIWCHFDGKVAPDYYRMIVSRLGNVFTLPDSSAAVQKLSSIYHTFLDGKTIREPLLSKQINDILTDFLLWIQEMPNEKSLEQNVNTMEAIVTYIQEHFSERITVEELAKMAMLSPYHFIRVFKRETSYTPHEYLLNLRINTAKYLLKTTQDSIKKICFDTGFSCESSFCAAFRKSVGVTPSEYRCDIPDRNFSK